MRRWWPFRKNDAFRRSEQHLKLNFDQIGWRRLMSKRNRRLPGSGRKQ